MTTPRDTTRISIIPRTEYLRMCEQIAASEAATRDSLEALSAIGIFDDDLVVAVHRAADELRSLRNRVKELEHSTGNDPDTRL